MTASKVVDPSRFKHTLARCGEATPGVPQKSLSGLDRGSDEEPSRSPPAPPGHRFWPDGQFVEALTTFATNLLSTPAFAYVESKFVAQVVRASDC